MSITNNCFKCVQLFTDVVGTQKVNGLERRKFVWQTVHDVNNLFRLPKTTTNRVKIYESGCLSIAAAIRSSYAQACADFLTKEGLIIKIIDLVHRYLAQIQQLFQHLLGFINALYLPRYL